MSTDALERLIELSRDVNNEVKAAAAYALGETGNPLVPKAVDRLISMTRDTNPMVKIAATKALGRLFRPKAK